MHRLLFFSLALVCLLAGCSAPQASDPAPDESNDLDAYFEEEPADNEMGSAEFGLQDPMDTVYTYDGESLEIPFSITGASSGKTTEIGVLLFVDGVAQPYSAVYEDGTELEESYMQIFNLDYEQQENFDMVFQPVTGKAGETVPVMAVTILEPSFVAEGPDNPRYGFHHLVFYSPHREIVRSIELDRLVVDKQSDIEIRLRSTVELNGDCRCFSICLNVIPIFNTQGQGCRRVQAIGRTPCSQGI